MNSRYWERRGVKRRFAAARVLGLRVRMPPETWMSVSCVFYVLSGTDFCDGLFSHPEESYRACDKM